MDNFLFTSCDIKPWDLWFKGFKSNNLYSKVTIFDWDSCTYGKSPLSGDSATIDGITYRQPGWPVDGHANYESSLCDFGVYWTSGTGLYAAGAGFPSSAAGFVSSQLNTMTGRQSDTVCWSSYFSPGCDNADGSHIFAVLSNIVGVLPSGAYWPY